MNSFNGGRARAAGSRDGFLLSHKFLSNDDAGGDTTTHSDPRRVRFLLNLLPGKLQNAFGSRIPSQHDTTPERM